MPPASYCREPSSLTINPGGIFGGFSVLRSGQGISGAPHWQACGEEPKSDGKRECASQNQNVHRSVGSLESLWPSADLWLHSEPPVTQANAFSSECNHRSITVTFFIIEARASHSVRYPQHIRA